MSCPLSSTVATTPCGSKHGMLMTYKIRDYENIGKDKNFVVGIEQKIFANGVRNIDLCFYWQGVKVGQRVVGGLPSVYSLLVYSLLQ